MQDLASEFSKIFRGDTSGPTQRPHGRGAQAPRCWYPNLGPPQLFSRGCAPAKRRGNYTGSRKRLVYADCVGVRRGAGRRRVRLRSVRRRSALGPRASRAERVVPTRAVRRAAAGLAQAVPASGHPRQADLRVAGVQDERASRSAVDDRSLDQLRHLHDDPEQQAAGTLDLSRSRPTLPARHLVNLLAPEPTLTLTVTLTLT